MKKTTNKNNKYKKTEPNNNTTKTATNKQTNKQTKQAYVARVSPQVVHVAVALHLERVGQGEHHDVHLREARVVASLLRKLRHCASEQPMHETQK
jgi:hypothetical protein